jgi:hypothetical protein
LSDKCRLDYFIRQTIIDTAAALNGVVKSKSVSSVVSKAGFKKYKKSALRKQYPNEFGEHRKMMPHRLLKQHGGVYFV